MNAPPLMAATLAALREDIGRIERTGRPAGRGVLPFDLAAVDARLAGGGLALAALHEAAAATPRPGDEAAAALFLAALGARLSRANGNRQAPGQVLWVFRRRDLFAPALALAGLGPERLIHAECRDDAEILAVMEDGLRHGGLAAVIGEIGRAAMPAVRRLQLAAEDGGTTALLRRCWRKADADPLAAPSIAVTRWRLACAPAAALPHAGLGRARWQVMLVRQRGGPPHQWLLEAPDAEARLALPARPGDRPDQPVRAPRPAGAAHAKAA